MIVDKILFWQVHQLAFTELGHSKENISGELRKIYLNKFELFHLFIDVELSWTFSVCNDCQIGTRELNDHCLLFQPIGFNVDPIFFIFFYETRLTSFPDNLSLEPLITLSDSCKHIRVLMVSQTLTISKDQTLTTLLTIYIGHRRAQV